MPGISFDRAADYYDQTRGYAAGVAEGIRDAIIAHVGASHATRFVEFGVGTGRIALPFITAGYRYCGVDLAREMMQQLRRKLGRPAFAGSERSSLCQADITHLPFAAHAFDVAIIVHVLHLVSDWQAALHEALRVLRRPGGWLLLAHDDPDESANNATEPSSGPIAARHAWAAVLRELTGVERHGRPHLNDNDLIGFFSGLGLEATRIDLAPYQRPPISARTQAEHFKARLYSSEWSMPDDLHAEATRRLDAWLNHECPDPDTPVSITGRFGAVAVRL